MNAPGIVVDSITKSRRIDYSQRNPHAIFLQFCTWIRLYSILVSTYTEREERHTDSDRLDFDNILLMSVRGVSGFFVSQHVGFT